MNSGLHELHGAKYFCNLSNAKSWKADVALDVPDSCTRPRMRYAVKSTGDGRRQPPGRRNRMRLSSVYRVMYTIAEW